jgi:hypothetical protein
MKPHKGRGSKLHLFTTSELDKGNGLFHATAVLPHKTKTELPVPLMKEAEWEPEPVKKFWRRKT